jgi:hypothetical protein
VLLTAIPRKDDNYVTHEKVTYTRQLRLQEITKDENEQNSEYVCDKYEPLSSDSSIVINSDESETLDLDSSKNRYTGNNNPCLNSNKKYGRNLPQRSNI